MTNTPNPPNTPTSPDGRLPRDSRLVELQTMLAEVVAAAEAHLTAVVAAEGAPDDDAVWHAYVELNNAARAYDQLLHDEFGEVTPWDLEELSPDEDGGARELIVSADLDSGAADDPYPRLVSVRQRRDYRVPSVSALLRAAAEARAPVAEGGPEEPVDTVAEAVLELLQAGDGSLGMLDVPELEPLDGVVVVAEVTKAYDADSHPETDAEAPFRMAPTDRIAARLDESEGPDPDEE